MLTVHDAQITWQYSSPSPQLRINHSHFQSFSIPIVVYNPDTASPMASMARAALGGRPSPTKSAKSFLSSEECSFSAQTWAKISIFRLSTMIGLSDFTQRCQTWYTHCRIVPSGPSGDDFSGAPSNGMMSNDPKWRSIEDTTNMNSRIYIYYIHIYVYILLFIFIFV